MNTYIALLRGINVSGQKKVSMTELRILFEKLNFKNVITYIQSGNVLFNTSKQDSSQLEGQIKNAIMAHFGFEVSVLVITSQELNAILDNCPFSDEKTEQSYFTLLHHIPDPNLVHEVRKIDYHNEEFIITNECVYFYCSTGYGRAKCNNNFFERKLKLTATTRNYKTMMKLLSLCEN